MMKKLLDNLGRLWNKVPKDFGALTIQQGSGTHNLVTIDTQQINFHSTPYRSDMPIKQSILLDEYNLDELVAAISDLGYDVTLTSEVLNKGYNNRKAYILMPIENITIISNATLTAFTAPLWQLLYPIARVLEELDNDTDSAISQLCADSASGSWEDYWATFFSLIRTANESDADFQKRIFIALINVKTSKIAIQELLKSTTNGTSIVQDVSPAQFSVTIDPICMDTAYLIHEIVNSVKGAGIDYFLNYQRSNSELYQAYYKDQYGVSFTQSDIPSSSAEIPFSECTYGYEQDRLKMFRIGSTKLLTDALKVLPKTMFDNLVVNIFYTEIKFTTPLDSNYETLQMQSSEMYLLPMESKSEVKEITLSDAAIPVLEACTSNITELFTENAFITPLDAMSVTMQIPSDVYPLPSEAQAYREIGIGEVYIDPEIKGLWGFRTNYSRFFSPTDASSVARLSILDTRVQESLSMTLTVDGVTVKTM